jgi:WhiB family redox-sensing transcriptional regulator
MTTRIPKWEDAACRGSNVNFLPAGPGNHTLNNRAAKVLCRTCPVQAECLAYALGDVTVKGIWGGTTTTEREQMRADRRKGQQP